MEDLNIQNKIKQIVITRLNQKKTARIAAESLGIHERTLTRYKKIFDIERCPVTRKYEFKEKKLVKI